MTDRASTVRSAKRGGSPTTSVWQSRPAQFLDISQDACPCVPSLVRRPYEDKYTGWLRCYAPRFSVVFYTKSCNLIDIKSI